MKTEIIAHECTHAANAVYDYIGASHSEDDEPFAYLVGYIAKCCDIARDNDIKTNHQSNIKMAKKKEEPIIIDPNAPLQCCYDCIHWHRKEDPNNPDAVDFSTGSCDHNGHSKVPPLFTCNGWASGNGEIYDKIHKIM